MAGSGRQHADAALIVALASGLAVADAARQAGVSARTAHRRLQEAPFRQAVATARAEMVARAVGVLSATAVSAAAQLGKLATEAQSETVQLGAARAVLELGARLRESEELEQRITALEACVAETAPAGRNGRAHVLR